MISATTVIRRVILVGAFAVVATFAAAQTPSPALLVVHQGENTLSIVDPKTGKVTGRVLVMLPKGDPPNTPANGSLFERRRSATWALSTAPASLMVPLC